VALLDSLVQESRSSKLYRPTRVARGTVWSCRPWRSQESKSRVAARRHGRRRGGQGPGRLRARRERHRPCRVLRRGQGAGRLGPGGGSGGLCVVPSDARVGAPEVPIPRACRRSGDGQPARRIADAGVRHRGIHRAAGDAVRCGRETGRLRTSGILISRLPSRKPNQSVRGRSARAPDQVSRPSCRWRRAPACTSRPVPAQWRLRPRALRHPVRKAAGDRRPARAALSLWVGTFESGYPRPSIANIDSRRCA
jgi:hypothetical protein